MWTLTFFVKSQPPDIGGCANTGEHTMDWKIGQYVTVVQSNKSGRTVIGILPSSVLAKMVQ